MSRSFGRAIVSIAGRRVIPCYKRPESWQRTQILGVRELVTALGFLEAGKMPKFG
jgi:hypothetical protein